jgi:hypothetical protein
MADDDKIVTLDSERTRIPGHHRIEGTDLEIAFNRQGDDLVVRVNKGPAQVFRALLVGACRDMSAGELFKFSPFSPDVVFTIGDMAEGLERAFAAAKAPAEPTP